MKKISALIIAFLLVLSIAGISAGAEAYNPNGGCEVKFNVKKADPAKVIKDGIIGEGEYEELPINNDPDTTDLLLSWVGGAEMYECACEFLKNVRYYFSWDEVHGFNFAVTAQHLEEIVQESEQPPEDFMSDKGMSFPGDGFIVAAGLMFRAYREDVTGDDYPDEVYYRSVSKRTDNGQYLIGYYFDTSHGYNGNAVFEPEKNAYISYGPDNTVTYELSIPLTDITVNGAVGDDVIFDISVVGGSDSRDISQAKAYIVSIGDNGYCTAKNATTAKSEAYATLVDETIEQAEPVNGDGEDNTGSGSEDNENIPDDEKSGGSEENDGAEEVGNVTEPGKSGNTGSGTNNGNTSSTKTGDCTAVFAFVSVLSAAGVYIGRKRK